jgi:uncharacterized C2H2 Zn-finger protein
MVHEFTAHRTETQWRCNLCAEKFQAQEQLQAHINSIHKLDFMSSQIAEVIAASKRLEPRDGGTEICPFCLVAPAQTQKAFARHVGRHLQEISLAALPLIDTSPNSDSDDEDDDNDQDGDSNQELESVQSNESYETLKDNTPSKASFIDYNKGLAAQILPAVLEPVHIAIAHEQKVSFTSQLEIW